MELMSRNMLMYALMSSEYDSIKLGRAILLFLHQFPIKIEKIAEIGVFHGDTSFILRQGYPNVDLYLIDPWEANLEYKNSDHPITRSFEKMEEAYLEVCKLFEGDPQVSILRKTSLEAAKDVPNDLDLVIIDGNHSYEHVKQDIRTWLPKLKSKGWMIGDDYYQNSESFLGIKKAVHEMFSDNEIKQFQRIWAYQKP